MSGEEKLDSTVVCVTGASGFIASYLVKLLLLRGYTVHATVRNPNDVTKTEHLKKLEGAEERLHLFKADLMEEGSFDSAIAGCEGVFHTASPVNFNVTDPQAQVMEPAVKGTMNVLAACKRSPSVRRVIFTSSASAVLFTDVPLTCNAVVDESWFSKPELCDPHDWKWYITSKILAEEAAWKYSKENGLDMVSMIPGMVSGPMLQPTLNESVAFILNLVNGAKTYPNTPLPWVHVEDVAEAHIRAFEIPSAHGRYCLAESVVYNSEIVKLVQKLYPTLPLPNPYTDNSELAEPFQVSKVKVKSLGIDYIPFEVNLKETIENLKEKKLLHSL